MFIYFLGQPNGFGGFQGGVTPSNLINNRGAVGLGFPNDLLIGCENSWVMFPTEYIL